MQVQLQVNNAGVMLMFVKGKQCRCNAHGCER